MLFKWNRIWCTNQTQSRKVKNRLYSGLQDAWIEEIQEHRWWVKEFTYLLLILEVRDMWHKTSRMQWRFAVGLVIQTGLLCLHVTLNSLRSKT
jgi:hypothetical protein